MKKYVNLTIRNEDVQGEGKVFPDYDSALRDAIWTAEKTVISWKEAKKHKVQIWEVSESDNYELELDIPFVRIWKVETNLHIDTWQDFQSYPETSEIKARKAEDAASDVMTWFDMDDVTPETEFKVYPVDGYGNRLDYAKIETFTAKELGW